MTDKTRERLLDRAAKLQALTQSDNVHEASLAAAKLQELLFTYNLEMADAKYASREQYGMVLLDITLGGPYTIVNWKRGLAHVVASNNLCRCVPLVEPKEGDRKGTKHLVALFGERQNIAIVKQLYAYLMVSVVRLGERDWLLSKSCKIGGNKVRWLHAFYIGAVNTIYARLKAQRDHDLKQEGGNAMVLVIEQKLDNLMDKVGGDTHKIAKPKPRGREAYEAGVRAGGEIGLGAQVTPGSTLALDGGSSG